MMKVKRGREAEDREPLDPRSRGADKDADGDALADRFLKDFDAEYRRRIKQAEAGELESDT